MKNSVTVSNFEDILGFDDNSTVRTRNTSSYPSKHIEKSSDLGTESDLADFWGVSTRQVRKLLSNQIIEKTISGHYEFEACTKRYLKHLSASARLRNGTDPELRAEKLRLVREQADAAELKNQEKRAELVPAKQVESEWADVLRTVRAGLLAIPGRVGARLALSQTHLSEIDIEIRTVLKELGE